MTTTENTQEYGPAYYGFSNMETWLANLWIASNGILADNICIILDRANDTMEREGREKRTADKVRKNLEETIKGMALGAAEVTPFYGFDEEQVMAALSGKVNWTEIIIEFFQNQEISKLAPAIVTTLGLLTDPRCVWKLTHMRIKKR